MKPTSLKTAVLASALALAAAPANYAIVSSFSHNPKTGIIEFKTTTGAVYAVAASAKGPLEPTAVLAQIEAKLGLLPDFGGTVADATQAQVDGTTPFGGLVRLPGRIQPALSGSGTYQSSGTNLQEYTSTTGGAPASKPNSTALQEAFGRIFSRAAATAISTGKIRLSADLTTYVATTGGPLAIGFVNAGGSAGKAFNSNPTPTVVTPTTTTPTTTTPTTTTPTKTNRLGPLVVRPPPIPKEPVIPVIREPNPFRSGGWPGSNFLNILSTELTGDRRLNGGASDG